MTPTGHTYTKADFERMWFDRDVAADALKNETYSNGGHKIEGSFYWRATSHGLGFWGDQRKGLNDDGRAALQEMIDQYDALHESEDAT